MHPPQGCYEPPLRGVPPGLAGPRGQLPVVPPGKVLGEGGERRIYLSGAGRRRLTGEPLGCGRGAGSIKIVRVVIKELDDDVAPDRLKRLPFRQKLICKRGGTSSVQPDRSCHHRLLPVPLTTQVSVSPAGTEYWRVPEAVEDSPGYLGRCHPQAVPFQCSIRVEVQ